MIYGRIINQTPIKFELEIATTKGDAQHFGLAGRIWLLKSKCRVTRWADGQLDSVEASPTLWRKVAQNCTTCD